MNIRHANQLRWLLQDAASHCRGSDRLPWCLFGSAVMQLHGLRDDVSDIDVAVSAPMFECLANRLITCTHVPDSRHPPFLDVRAGGGSAHIFYAWRADEPEVDLGQCRALAEQVDGWWCAPLREIRRHKVAGDVYCMQRYGHIPLRYQKHAKDVKLIDAYLQTGVTS